MSSYPSHSHNESTKSHTHRDEVTKQQISALPFISKTAFPLTGRKFRKDIAGHSLAFKDKHVKPLGKNCKNGLFLMRF